MLKSAFVFFFRFFFRLFFRSHIASVLLKTENLEALTKSDLPVVILANHSSWWDGCLILLLSESLMPNRALKIAMLSSELEKRKWLKYLGAIAIDPQKPTQLLHFFRSLTSMRSGPRPLCLGYFFEGTMAAPGEAQLPPKRGTSLVLKQLAPAFVLPTSLLIDSRFRSKPSAYVNIGAPVQFENSQDIVEFVLAVKTLTKETVEATSKAQEYTEKLLSSGWKKLW